MRAPLTVASFFSGVGLLDLGLEWAGWKTVSVSEINPYASRILSLRYPDAPNLGDIHAIQEVPQATLWAGGFPCQPVSVAGKRRAQDDSRWLWPRWMDLIREFRPPYLLLENVSNLLAVNNGRAFGDVLGDLAACGYDAEWDCIPASAVGAPHPRSRVWIICHARRGTAPHLAYPEGAGEAEGLHPSWWTPAQPGGGRRRTWRYWATEPGVGRVVDGVPHRVDRLRCLGNGVVPQVAEFIGWRLREAIEGAVMEEAA